MKLKYPNDPECGEEHLYNEEAKAENSTVECLCGNKQLLVNWLRYPHAGGFLKVTCTQCGHQEKIFDDYA